MLGKKIIDLLNKTAKSYLTFSEIAGYLRLDKSILKVTLSRLVRQQQVRRLLRGYYSLPAENVDLEQLAVELCYPAYISLESALASHGLIDQLPTGLTLVTTKRSVIYQVGGTSLEFAHLKPTLFFGYKINGQTQIARPEKALLDVLYLIGLKKRSLDLSGLNSSKINKNLLKKWLKFYPPSTAALVEKLGLIAAN